MTWIAGNPGYHATKKAESIFFKGLIRVVFFAVQPGFIGLHCNTQRSQHHSECSEERFMNKRVSGNLMF